MPMVPGVTALVDRVRARAAVAALFFVNGALTGNLVPRFPDIKADLGLSNTAFGSALGAYPIASNAFATTTIAAAVASFVWPMCEWLFPCAPLTGVN